MATFTWLGGSGNWNDSNWSISGPSAQPLPSTPADTAFVNGSGTYVLTVPLLIGTLAGNVTLSDPNAVLQIQSQGTVISDTLDIAAGTVSLATNVILLPATLINDGTIASLGLGAYSSSIAVSNGFTNNSAIDVDGDTLAIDGNFSQILNDGTVSVSNSGTVHFSGAGTFSNPGIMTLGSNAILELSTTVFQVSGAPAGFIDFQDSSPATLILNTLPFGTATTTVENFQPGNTIDFLGALTFDLSQTATALNNAIVISEHGSVVASIPEVGAATNLHVSNDGAGWAEILACFAEGTRLLTPSGEIPVRELRVGDLVTTCSGRITCIRWLGHRRIDCRRAPRPLDIFPVRIEAGAFGPGMPLRDLWLSPDHAVFVTDGTNGSGVLVPIRYLINGKTVAQVSVDDVTYWHVELDKHDIVLADGMPAETYLDTGNRDTFANGGQQVQLDPDFAPSEWLT